MNQQQLDPIESIAQFLNRTIKLCSIVYDISDREKLSIYCPDRPTYDQIEQEECIYRLATLAVNKGFKRILFFVNKELVVEIPTKDFLK